MQWCVVTIVLTCVLWTTLNAFNVDIDTNVLQRGPTGSLFGFSVAQHADRGEHWLLVGAPEAETGQPGVTKPGTVFRCSPEYPDTCQTIPFDRTGNNRHLTEQIDEKSYQWFGATVHSSGENGVILACAPRYVWFSSNAKRREPVGTCFISRDSFREYVEYPPCRTADWGYHRQGSCQAGLGASVSPDGRRLFIGGVGSWYWQGQVFRASAVAQRQRPRNFSSELVGFLSPGQLFSQDLYSRLDIKSTPEGPANDDDSYLGYSIAVGEFNGDTQYDVAAGMPRGNNLTGKVILYTSNLTILYDIRGSQIGEYFGYALCVSDVDGDGTDDVVIGSPMYTDYTDSEMKFDTGRVYVVYQGKADLPTSRFKRVDKIDGKAHRGRFGQALSSLGDINKDGFGDFAVGAPYAGASGRGAVYVYHGSATGIRKEYSQVIYAEDINRELRTFGFSISGGMDMDGNEYPDVLVGAYESDAVIFFRSRPVINLNAKLSFKSETGTINLDEKTCSLLDGTAVSCIPINICLDYDGLGVDKRMQFEVQYVLDAKKPKSPRMFFLNQEGRNSINQTLTLDKNNAFCKSMMVYLSNNIRDKLSSIEAELRYSLRLERRRSSRDLQPILNLNVQSVQKDSIGIQKNCGPDNICIPNLELAPIAFPENYIMGSKERIEFDVVVVNKGEDSFESMFYMGIPSGLHYIGVRASEATDVQVLCSAPTGEVDNQFVKCDIGNPLPAGRQAFFHVMFQPVQSPELKSTYDFVMEANSTNPENNFTKSDNYFQQEVRIVVETQVNVGGVSSPEQILYKSALYTGEVKSTEEDIGPEVNHTYELTCTGPSSISHADVYILWPSHTRDGDHLLYLLQQPIVSGRGQCETIEEINPLKLLITRKPAFFDADKAIESSYTRTGHRRVIETHTAGSSGVSGGRTVVTTSSSSTRTSGGHTEYRGSRIGGGEHEYDNGHRAGVTADLAHGSVDTYGGSSSYDRTGPRTSTTYESTHGGRDYEASSSTTYGSGGHRGTSETRGAGASYGSTTYESSQGTRTYENRSGSGTYDRTYGSRTGTHDTRTGGSATYDTRTGGSGTYDARREGSATYETRGGGSATYDTRTGAHDTRTGGSGAYDTRTGTYETRTRTHETSRTGGSGHYGGGYDTRSGFDRTGSRTYGSSSANRSGYEATHGSRTGTYEATSGSRTNYGATDYGSRTGHESRTHEGSRTSYSGSAATYGAGSYGHEGAIHTGYETQVIDTSQQVGQSETEGTTERFRGFEDLGSLTGEGETTHHRVTDTGVVQTGDGRRSRTRTEHRVTDTGDVYTGSGARTRTRTEQRAYESQSRSSTGGSAHDYDRSQHLGATATGDRQYYSGSEARGAAGTEHHRVTDTGDVDLGGGRRGRTRTEHTLTDTGDVDLGGGRRQRTRTEQRTYESRSSSTHAGSAGRDVDQDLDWYRRELEARHQNLDESGKDGGDYSYSHSGSYDVGGRKVHYTREGSRSHSGSEHQEELGGGYQSVKEERTETRGSRTYEIRERRSVDEDLDRELDCGPTRCTIIRCKVGPLRAGENVVFQMRSRLWLDTVHQSGVDDLYLSSKMIAHVRKLPHNVDPSFLELPSKEIVTEIVPEPDYTKGQPIQWWVVVLAAVGGVIILLLIVLLLWKLGFFKRKRPHDIPEREPLHRNGHFQPGDEAL